MSRALRKHTIVDRHKNASIAIAFSIVAENDAEIFMYQPENKERQEVMYQDLMGFVMATCQEILIKFHHYERQQLPSSKKGLVEAICRLHGVAIVVDDEKLNLDQKQKEKIMESIKNDSDDILILVQEFMERDPIYSTLFNLFAAMDCLYAEEQTMNILENSLCQIYKYLADRWMESQSAPEFVLSYSALQQTLHTEQNLRRFDLKELKTLFGNDIENVLNVTFGQFMYGMVVMVKKIIIHRIRYHIADVLLEILQNRNKRLSNEFKATDMQYFAYCFLGSSITSYLRVIHSKYKHQKKGFLDIVNAMLIKYRSKDELQDYDIPAKLLRENDGHLRLIRPEFTNWTINILETISETFKKAIVTVQSLDCVSQQCATDDNIHKFLVIFSELDSDDSEEDGAWDYKTVKEVAGVLIHKLCTRMVWAMIKDKKNIKVEQKVRDRAKMMHLSNKRLELCKK